MGEGVSTGISRRDLLAKAAVAGGVVWAAPVLMSTPAFAAGTVGSDLCIDANGNARRVTSMTFDWIPGNGMLDRCDGGDDYENPINTGTWSGDNTGDWAGATVSAYGKTGNSPGQATATVTPSSLIAPDPDADPPVPGVVRFTVSGWANNNNELYVTLTEVGGDGEQTIRVHISCSSPICFGDQYGSLQIVSYTAV